MVIKPWIKWCCEFKNSLCMMIRGAEDFQLWLTNLWKKIENAIHDNRRLTMDELSAIFLQISISLLHETITETLRYRKLSPRWAPKKLKGQHKLNWVEVGQEFLRCYKCHGDEFLHSIIGGDEAWVHTIHLKPKGSEEVKGRWRSGWRGCGKLLRKA